MSLLNGCETVSSNNYDTLIVKEYSLDFQMKLSEEYSKLPQDSTLRVITKDYHNLRRQIRGN